MVCGDLLLWYGVLLCVGQEVIGGRYRHVWWVDVGCISFIVCLPIVCLVVLVARWFYSNGVFLCCMLCC